MTAVEMRSTTTSAVTRALTQLVGRIPSSEEPHAADPRTRSLNLRNAAARKAAGISAGLALPPGPLGLLTILPDLAAIWKLQSALVADIAAVYGKSAFLTRGTMIYCLFKHGGAALARDVVARAGERFVMRPATLRATQAVLAKIGVRVTKRTIGRAAARWIPFVGAAGVGVYAYMDTKKVGANAMELFAADIAVAANDETA